MKKSLIAMAVLAAAAGSASAQSSVTVFGIVDVAVRHTDTDGTTKTTLSNGGLSTGRIGFRGVEDLGGGLKAGFWLESEVKTDAGSSDTNRFWGRRATVSLISDSLGEVRLGRDFVPTYTALSDFDAFGDNGIGAVMATYGIRKVNNVTADTQKRADNEVSYFLPNTLGGIYGQLSVAAGEGTAGKKYVGGRAGYRTGPVDVTVAYAQTELASSDDKYKILVVGGSYDFGVAKILASYQEGKYEGGAIDGQKDKLYSVGVTAPVGAFVVRAAYVRTDTDDAVKLNANHFSLGAIYNLSKRTALYGTYSIIDNDDKGVYTISEAPAFDNGVAGKKSQGVEFGIKHSF